jgi:hypothetical protein
MNKVKSSGTLKGARGGKTKMLPKTKAGTVKPGTTAGASSRGGKFAAGGGHKMVGKGMSYPAKRQ